MEKDRVDSQLASWQQGYLEIHHIATNRGNSTFLILPDGTTMMVNAGALYGTSPYLSEEWSAPVKLNQSKC